MSPLKFFIIANADFPEGRGGTPRIRNIAKGLVELGHGVKIYIPHAAGYVEQDQNTAVEGLFEGIFFKFLNNSTSRPSNEYQIIRDKIIGNIKLCYLLLSRKKPDISVVYNYSLLETGLYILLAKLFRVKIIFDVCDERFDQHAVGHQKSFFRLVNSIHYKFSDWILFKIATGFFVVSEFLNMKILRLRKFPSVHFIPLVAEIPETIPIDTNLVYRNTLVYAGSIIPDEGIEILIDALEMIQGAIDINCILIGGANNASYKRILDISIQDKGLSSHISFVGNVAYRDLQKKLLRADVLVLPRPDSIISKAGFPGKLSEYLYSNRPIVATNFGDIKKYFDKTTMYISNDATAQSFAKMILEAFHSIEERDNIGKNACVLGRSLFDYHTVCKKIVNYSRSLQ